MNVKMWGLMWGNTMVWHEDYPSVPSLFMTREDARLYRSNFAPGSKVVRVQVDVKVIE